MKGIPEPVGVEPLPGTKNGKGLLVLGREYVEFCPKATPPEESTTPLLPAEKGDVLCVLNASSNWFAAAAPPLYFCRYADF